MSPAPLAGIFVGGGSTRMGGRPKGLLAAPDTGEPLAVRLARLARGVGCEVVLVGRADAYREALPHLPVLEDAPGIDGPLAGLSALLAEAGERPALALACDLPFVTASLLQRLLDAPAAPIVAPRARPDAPWEPLLARYAPSEVAPVLEGALRDGIRSFQRLFARLAVQELPLATAELEQLRDWDEPSDVR